MHLRLNPILLLQVAQEGLSGSVPGNGHSTRLRSSGLGSYPEIHVPVYAAVKGVSIFVIDFT